jgi:hypothetical protein
VTQTGTIKDIFLEGGITKARVGMEGASRIVTLVLLLDAHVGDEVTIDKGIALALVGEEEAVV